MHDLTELVEPRLGNLEGRWISFSSASRPFGMVNLSPDTKIDGDWRCGYNLGLDEIVGFSHIHSWQIGGILLMPCAGTVQLAAGPEGWKSRFSRETEVCKPGYHRVHLDRYGITAELTSTLRVGVHRYTFSNASDASIAIDLTSQCGPCEMGPAELRQTGPRFLEGWITNRPTFRKPKDLKIYLVIEADRDVSLGQFDPAAIRAVLRLPAATRDVTLKVAISYTSVAAARANMSAEASGASFDAIREASREEWNQWLSRIVVEGGSKNQIARFYTDLFFSLLGRRTMNDASGTYIDNTGSAPVVRQIPLNEQGLPRYRHFNSDAFWGAQWSLIPLWLIAYPELIDGFSRCFLDMYRNGGLIPRGPSSGNDTFVMTSAQTTPLYSAGIATGVFKPDDVEEVYQAVRKNHMPGGLMSKAGYEHATCLGGGIEDYLSLGYIPEDLPNVGLHTNGAAQTVEHSFNDWHLAQLAHRLGKTDDASTFEKRSKHWRNLFDKNAGFLRPRNRDGSWLEPYSPWARKGWTEANAWTYTFYASHDVAGLIELFGSRERMLERLEEAFSITRDLGYYVQHESHEKIPFDFGNEPALCAAHFFHLAGSPHRTQHWVREVLTNLKSGNQPHNSFGGDEDEGIMGAWNVLASIGLFSATCVSEPGGKYQIIAPIFDRVRINLNPDYFDGGAFVIERYSNPTATHAPIRSASYNGQALPNFELSHASIVSGGTLVLE